MSRRTFYRGFNIEAAIAELPDHGGRWNQQVMMNAYVGSATVEWVFPIQGATAPTEEEAVANCFEIAKRIIDGEIRPPVVCGEPFPLAPLPRT